MTSTNKSIDCIADSPEYKDLQAKYQKEKDKRKAAQAEAEVSMKKCK